MIKALAHVCILSRNLEKTRAFYCDVLGLAKGFDFLRDGKLTGYYLTITPGQFIEVFQTGDESPEPPARRILHLCLETDDMDGISKKLRDAGCEVTEKFLGADHSWQIWTKDPDGTAIEFHQYTPQSTQLTGEPCILPN